MGVPPKNRWMVSWKIMENPHHWWSLGVPMDWKLDPYGIIWSNGSTARTTGPLDGLVLVDSFVQKVPGDAWKFLEPQNEMSLNNTYRSATFHVAFFFVCGGTCVFYFFTYLYKIYKSQVYWCINPSNSIHQTNSNERLANLSTNLTDVLLIFYH